MLKKHSIDSFISHCWRCVSVDIYSRSKAHEEIIFGTCFLRCTLLIRVSQLNQLVCKYSMTRRKCILQFYSIFIKNLLRQKLSKFQKSLKIALAQRKSEVSNQISQKGATQKVHFSFHFSVEKLEVAFVMSFYILCRLPFVDAEQLPVNIISSTTNDHQRKWMIAKVTKRKRQNVNRKEKNCHKVLKHKNTWEATEKIALFAVFISSSEIGHYERSVNT